MSCPLSETDIQARLLYRDGLILIIDKPAGIAVHAGPSGGPNLESCFHFLQFGLPRPPALGHRLDRDTSGCLVLGRHPKALRRLGRIFSEGRAQKTYWAVVKGSPPADSGIVDLPLKKISNAREGWRMIGSPDGLAAMTRYRVRGRDGTNTWLELEPQTGRTHQIRVHCAALGCAILGDPIYGEGMKDGTSLQLHARSLQLPLYPGKNPILAIAPVPGSMHDWLKPLGWSGESAGAGP